MDARQILMVRTSYAFFKPCGTAIVAEVVRNLTDHHPAVRAILPDDTAPLHRKWFDTLGQVVEHADRFSRLHAPLAEIGRRAAAAGAQSGHYRIIRNELLSSMEELAADDWTPALRRAWALLLDAAVGAMLAGALERRAA